MSHLNLEVKCPACETVIDVEDDLPYDEGSLSQIVCSCGAVLDIGFYRVAWVSKTNEVNHD